MNPSKHKTESRVVQRQTIPLAMLGVFCLSLAVPARSTVVDAPQAEKPITADQAGFFESKIRPVLVESCLGCHGEKTQIAGVRLDSRAAILGKVDSGPIVVPGKPDESLLIKVIRYNGPIKMPKSKKLPANQIADLEAWVEMGAPWPKAAASGSIQEGQALWSLRPLSRPQVPKLAKDKWSINELDSFILKGLLATGLAPTPVADKRTLIRRLSSDLLGLPPTFEEVSAFVGDKAPNAYEKLVDRYLASPRYGERWARHWLDVARYADTKGYVFEEDRNYPHAYTYRNWVIDALNRDLPYNQFIEQQLAADLLPGAMEADDRSSLAAMGFLTVGRRFLNQTPDIIDDRIDVTTRGFMGFTVACARCHDHKFDPVPTQDYYSLYSIFNSTKEGEVPISQKAIRDPWERHRAKLVQTAQAERQLVSDQVKALRKRDNLPNEVKGVLQGLREEVIPTGDVLAKLKQAFDPEAQKRHRDLESQIASLTKETPRSPEFAMAVLEGDNPHDIRVFKRGNPGNPGEVAPRRFLAALSSSQKDREHWKQGSGRLELAKAIASPENPLTPRVIVNRVWMHHFGHGLVRTPSDFGFQGEKPSHPELLDYLAGRFIKDGWSLKKLHRLIVTSATYRQGSVATSKHYAKDPENRFLGRMNRRRIGLEEMRDAVVAASGTLDTSSVGGKSVDLWAQPFTNRRAVYGFVERQNLPGVFRTFDFASPDTTNPKRFQTTVPQQALFFLNSPFAIEHSHKIAGRKEVASLADPKEKAKAIYRLVLGRSPSENELAAGGAYLALAAPSAPLPAWEYGVGALDGDRVSNFRPLGFFAGDHYRVSETFPDPTLGFALLNGAGGHPGKDDRSAVIRRFRVPVSGTYQIRGDIGHPEKQGNGIRASIISSRKGLLGRWTVFNRTEKVRLNGLQLEAGEIVDFVADPNGSDSFDAFGWSPIVIHTEAKSRWEASRDFGAGSKLPKPSRAAMFAQILLMTNEFLFID